MNAINRDSGYVQHNLGIMGGYWSWYIAYQTIAQQLQKVLHFFCSQLGILFFRCWPFSWNTRETSMSSCLPYVWKLWNKHKLPSTNFPLLLNCRIGTFQIWRHKPLHNIHFNCRLKSDGFFWYFCHGQPGWWGGVRGGVVCCWGGFFFCFLKPVKIPKSIKFVGMKFNQGTHFESNEIVIVQGSCQVGGGLDQREECSRIAPPQNGNGIARKLFLPRKMENMCFLCYSGGLHVGAVEDNGGKPCQAIIQLYKIQSTSDQPRLW